MLTADLVRARLVRGEVHPQWLAREQGPAADALRARAAELVAVFEAASAEGRARRELDDTLEDLIAGRPDFKLDRGLVKLLEERTTFTGVEPEAAAARRKVVFLAAAEARRNDRFERGMVIHRAAMQLGQTQQEVELGLYADHPEEERVVGFEPLAPDELLRRYDLALAQAVLLRALTLEVRVEQADPPRLRQLIRGVKFQGLLTEAVRDEQGAVVLRLDGPLSIFESTPRYGVKMAGFLPALLLCEVWSLEAQVQFGRGRAKRRFRLGPQHGLVGRARDAGAWLPELIEAFERRFAEVAPDWRVDRDVPLLNLGGEVVVPDFRLVHRESGWEASLEVLGYWRKGGVARRLAALREHGAPRLVLALEQSLRVGDQDLDGIEGPIVPFRDIPDARKVKKILEGLRAAR